MDGILIIIKVTTLNLWLFHLHDNQLKHTLDSVAVTVLSKVRKFRNSERHVHKEA